MLYNITVETQSFWYKLGKNEQMNPNDKCKKGTKSLNNNNQILNMSWENCSNLFLVLLKKKIYHLN